MVLRGLQKNKEQWYPQIREWFLFFFPPLYPFPSPWVDYPFQILICFCSSAHCWGLVDIPLSGCTRVAWDRKLGNPRPHHLFPLCCMQCVPCGVFPTILKLLLHSLCPILVAWGGKVTWASVTSSSFNVHISSAAYIKMKWLHDWIQNTYSP